MNPVMEALMVARANDRLIALKYEEAPRSWSKDAKFAFLRLPPELQSYYVVREKQRDREVNRAQNGRVEALRKLALAEARIAELEKLTDNEAIQPTEEANGTAQSVAA
jgi:hypothetical protein